ncbi:MAG: hypothetical protein II876_00575 [Synergistaceae bacterium]|nr:hypothetical protein [Synergistaceae bacterium]
MRTRIFIGLAVIAGLISLSDCETLAHGTGYRHSEFRAVALEFMYSTGEMMSYREARVFSPNDEKFAYQTGRTDEKGRFSFTPDTSGTWRVIVRDEEGHQCTAEIDVTEEFLAGKSDGTPQHDDGTLPQGMGLFIRALLGVSIIFNIAMIVRRRYAH